MGDLFAQISHRIIGLETYVARTNDALLEQIGAVDGAAKVTGQEALRRIGLVENALGKLKPDVSVLLERVDNVQRTIEEVVSEVASNVVAEIVRDQKLVTAGALQECVNSVVGRSASLERQLATLDERITGHVGQVRNDVTALQQRSDNLEGGVRDCKTALEDAQGLAIRLDASKNFLERGVQTVLEKHNKLVELQDAGQCGSVVREHVAAELAQERTAIEGRLQDHVAAKLAEERTAIEERMGRAMRNHVAAKLEEERTAIEERAWTNVEKRAAQLVTDALSTFRAEHDKVSADDVAALKALVTKQQSEIEALRSELRRRRGEVEPREREYQQAVWAPRELLREDNDAGVPALRLDGGVSHAAQGALVLEGAEPGGDGHGDDAAASHETPGAGPDASDDASAHELPQWASEVVAENAADVPVAPASRERRKRTQTELVRRFFEEATRKGIPRKTAHGASVQDVTMTAAGGSPSAPSASGSSGTAQEHATSYGRKRALPADGAREERPAKRRAARRELANVGGPDSSIGTSASEIEMVPTRPSDDTPISQWDIRYLAYASLNDLRRLRDHLKTLPKPSVKRACDEDLQQWTGDPSEIVVDARKRLPFPKGSLIVNGAIWSERYARAYEVLAWRLRDVEKIWDGLCHSAILCRDVLDVEAPRAMPWGDWCMALARWIASQEGDAVVAPTEDEAATLGLTADAFVSLLGFWSRPLEPLAMARIEHDFVHKAGLAVKIQTVASYSRVADIDVALGATVVVGATYANWRRWCVLECRAVGGRGGHCTRTALVPVVTGKAEGLQQALEECGYGVTMLGGDTFKSSSKTTKIMECDEGLFHCLELVLKRAKGSGVATQLESATREAFRRMYYACAWRAFQSRGEPDQSVVAGAAPRTTVRSAVTA